MKKQLQKLLIFFVLLLTAAGPLCAAVGAAYADSVTDTLGIYVGYYGWKEEKYVEKATYHWTELDDMFGGNLPTHDEIYSYYNGGGRTYLVGARGFYVRDLLEYAGIDFNSIASVDFFTKDHDNGAYRSFTAASLFSTPRYYFPNLAANEATGQQYAYDGGDIWTGATMVEAMMALEDYTEWDVPGSEFEQLYSPEMRSPNCRFHLFFGQTDPTEASTSSAAKYCYKISITFSGKPILTTAESNLDMKVGSGHKIEVNVDAEDSILNDLVRNNLTWSSSDENVVQVAPDGTLTVLAPGDAQITASFGDSAATVSVYVGEDEEENTEAQPQPAAPVTTDDSQEGTGTGGDGGAGGQGTGAGADSTGGNSVSGAARAGTPGGAGSAAAVIPQPRSSAQSAPAAQPDTKLAEAPAAQLPEQAEAVKVPVQKVFRLDPAVLTGARSGQTDVEEGAGAKMDEDTEQLVLHPEKKNLQVPLVLSGVFASFAGGFVFERIRFRRLLGIPARET